MLISVGARLGPGALLVLIGLFLANPGTVWAYNGSTHKLIVADAIDYMLDSPYATPLQKNAALYYLYKYNHTRASLKAYLGQESKKFDKLKDMWIQPTGFPAKKIVCAVLGSWLGSYAPTHYGNDYYTYTALNHFQVRHLAKPLNFWLPDHGYYYPNSSKKGTDHKATADSRVDYCDRRLNLRCIDENIQ